MLAGFSCTAPRWETKQDDMEKASLTEEEKKAIENEIFGQRGILRETPTMVARTCALMQDAVDLIPDEQKQSYIQALVQCPELVRTESEPLRFLRCERFNTWVRISSLDALSREKRQSFIGNSVRGFSTKTFLSLSCCLSITFRTLLAALCVTGK
jgi:hypothetical protein